MDQGLTREQFTVLTVLSETANPSAQQMEERTGLSAAMLDQTLKDLSLNGCLYNGALTQSGLQALEPYRVKKAVFIAAGFGSRLAPITINTPKPLVRVHGIRIIDRLIDACLAVGIDDIYIIRGYLAEQFDQLLYKYPMLTFLENPAYDKANNIGSALVAKSLLANAYVLEADLLLSEPGILKKYHYTSDFLGIKKQHSDDWCFQVKDGIIAEQKVGGDGDDIWQMVGISYWNENDGRKLCKDIERVYQSPGGRELYWEQVPLRYCRDHYQVAICDCLDTDILEIDTFNELKAVDAAYNI